MNDSKAVLSKQQATFKIFSEGSREQDEQRTNPRAWLSRMMNEIHGHVKPKVGTGVILSYMRPDLIKREGTVGTQQIYPCEA